MTTMVERVARGIYHGKARNRPWEELPVEFQRQYRKQARGAIEAMREPTEAMHDAVRDWSFDKYGKPIGIAASEGCWHAMIDAALKEEVSR